MKKAIQAAVGFLISGVFLWLAFRSIDIQALGASMKSMQPIYILPFLAITMLQMWWRAIRWKLLVAPQKQVSARALFGPMMVGFAFNSVFPARAGEVARPLALQRTEGIPFAAGLSTVVVERLLDAITLLVVLAVVPLILPFDPTASQEWDGRWALPGQTLAGVIAAALIAAGGALAFWAWRLGDSDEEAPAPSQSKLPLVLGIGAAVALIGAIAVALGPFIDKSETYEFGSKYVLNAETFERLGRGLSRTVAVLLFGVIAMMIPPVQRFALAIIARLPLVPEKFREGLAGLFRRFTEGFAALKSPRVFALVVMHSIVVWGLGGFSFQVMSWGIPGLHMTFAHAMAYLAITAIAISLPSAPGFWGLYEAGGIVAMMVLGLVPGTEEGRALALGYTIVCHFFQWLPITVIGLIYAAKIHVRNSAQPPDAA